MKTSINKVLITMLCTTMLTAAVAQTPTPDPMVTTPVPTVVTSTTTQTATFPGDKSITDPDMSNRLNADLRYRNNQLTSTSPINLADAGNGNYGTYAVGSNTYMTRYDKEGNYVGTFQQEDWNSDFVPADLKTSYSKSPYKSNEVTGYWTSTDPDKKGYYLETKNSKGKATRIWGDDKGKLSTVVPSSQPRAGGTTTATSKPK